jgi:hypothetical protein
VRDWTLTSIGHVHVGALWILKSSHDIPGESQAEGSEEDGEEVRFASESGQKIEHDKCPDEDLLHGTL